jgi:Flp pilus assembly protein TadB
MDSHPLKVSPKKNERLKTLEFLKPRMYRVKRKKKKRRKRCVCTQQQQGRRRRRRRRFDTRLGEEGESSRVVDNMYTFFYSFVAIIFLFLFMFSVVVVVVALATRTVVFFVNLR